jgi:hypothetical protein
VEDDLDAGEFQVDQPLQGGIQGQVGETSARCGNKHASPPSGYFSAP